MTITGQSSLDKDDIQRWSATPRLTPRTTASAATRPRSATTPTRSCTRPRRCCASRATRSRADERAAVEGPLADLKKALAGNDIEAIKSATERLMTASQSFSQKLYEAASREQQTAAGRRQTTAPRADDDEVVDAEIVDDERSA